MSTIIQHKRRGLCPQRSNPFERRRKAFENKPLSTDPHAQNPVYTHKTHLKCPFCEGTRASKKWFNNAWKLYNHCRRQHSNESSLMSTIRKIADAIIGEMR